MNCPAWTSTVPFATPPWCGAKVTVKSSFWLLPTKSGSIGVPNEKAPLDPAAKPADSAVQSAEPKFHNDNVWVTVWPTVTWPKLTALGISWNWHGPGLLPVPVIGTTMFGTTLVGVAGS